MKIEIGKCYKNRKGEIIGPIRMDEFIYVDPGYSVFNERGEYGGGMVGADNEYDLIEEYIEPQQVETWGVIDTKELNVVATFGTLHHASLFATEMNKRGSYKIVKLCGELK